MQYLGKTDGSVPDTPENFYFTGPWAMDFAVLFQLSAWDDTVEFGWYQAGNPGQPNEPVAQDGPAPGPLQDNIGEHQSGRHGLGRNPGCI